MKKMKIVAFALATSLAISGGLFAFNWPQEETSSDSFKSYFGEFRGGTINSSLIFKDSAQIKAADTGNVLLVLSDHTNSFGWFESTLGTAIILGHEDQRETVYANLDDEKLPSYISSTDTVTEGTVLGVSGNSGWQDGISGLEFQVLDTKSSIAVNPRMLVSKSGAELPFKMGYITLDDENGVTHNLINERYLRAGTYYIYKSRTDAAMPFRTLVSINGATVERINYDTLKDKSGRLCVVGASMYPVELMYPDSNRMLLGKIALPSGHVGLSVTIINIQNEADSVTYNLEVN